MTALQLAARDGAEGIVRLLLESGCDAYSIGSCHDTPLTLAAEYGHGNISRLLLNNNANVEGSQLSELTPLLACAKAREENVDIAKALIERGASVQSVQSVSDCSVSSSVGLFCFSQSVKDNFRVSQSVRIKRISY
jgi:ankyrin repeat protein